MFYFYKIGINRFSKQLFWFCVYISWIPILCVRNFPPSRTNTPPFREMILMPESSTLLVWWLPTTLIVFVIGSVAMTLQREWKLFPALLFLPCSLLIPLINAEQFPGVWVLVLLFLLFVFSVSVWWALKNAHLLSPAFIIFSFVLFVDAILAFASVKWESLSGITPIFGWIYELYAPDIATIILIIVFAIFIRVIYLIIVQNRSFFAELSAGEIKKFIKKAAKLWLPMPVIFIFATLTYTLIFYYSASKYVDTVVHHVQNKDNKLIDPLSKAVGKDQMVRPDDGGDVEWASLYYQRAVTLTLRSSLLAGTKKARVAAVSNSDTASRKAADHFEQSLPSRAPGTQVDSCSFLNFPCYFMNLVKSITNSIYQSFKRNIKNTIDRKLAELHQTIDENAKNYQQQIDSEIDRIVNEANRELEAGMASTFSGFSKLQLAATLYSLIILFKTYLIVLGRVVFSIQSHHTASFGTGKIPPSHGDRNIEIKTVGGVRLSRVMFPTDDPKEYYVSRKLAKINFPDSRRRPKPFLGIFSRLANGVHSLNRVHMKGRDQQAGIEATLPSNLVTWNLKRGEQIIFWFGDLGGFTADIKIRRVVSFSLSTLIFGRSIFYCAEGPGTLIIATEQAAIKSGVHAGYSYSVPAFVAWDFNSKFKVDANLTMMDTFRSGINVKRNSKSDNVLIDTSAENRGIYTGGIIRYITSFLLPI